MRHLSHKLDGHGKSTILQVYCPITPCDWRYFDSLPISSLQVCFSSYPSKPPNKMFRWVERWKFSSYESGYPDDLIRILRSLFLTFLLLSYHKISPLLVFFSCPINYITSLLSFLPQREKEKIVPFIFENSNVLLYHVEQSWAILISPCERDCATACWPGRLVTRFPIGRRLCDQ